MTTVVDENRKYYAKVERLIGGQMVKSQRVVYEFVRLDVRRANLVVVNSMRQRDR